MYQAGRGAKPGPAGFGPRRYNHRFVFSLIFSSHCHEQTRPDPEVQVQEVHQTRHAVPAEDLGVLAHHPVPGVLQVRRNDAPRHRRQGRGRVLRQFARQQLDAPPSPPPLSRPSR
ncbi:hypothetical protein CBM2608_A300060 [Cupriavidus taiwanensis]|nr:hypothetical protein CBM2608_A300060 [Cupriavidus taiwanensis]